MKGFIDFVQANKEWLKILAYLLISVISTVVIILLKKKKVLNEFDLIILKVMERLPGFINQAEVLKGADVKKAFVLKCIQEFVKEQFSVILPDSVLSSLGVAIENILSTPQKHS